MESAILLTSGMFRTPFAKTAHGLIRGPSRYQVVGVVDATCADEDAGDLLDGMERAIPIRASLANFLERGERATHCVIGVATEGGRIPADLRGELLIAARAGMTIVNGLHELLTEDAELVEAAKTEGAQLVDLRRPRPASELRFWTGEVLSLEVPRVAILGTDCAVGKRTTATLLRDQLRAEDVRAELIYTGQTGWMQGGTHGFLFDATLNDFVPGELEGAILGCAKDCDPQVILLEGQSSLRNPSGPAGAELLLSGGARGVVLQHAPGREYFEGFRSIDLRMPALEQELELIGLYGSEVWALTLNLEGRHDVQSICAEYEERLGIPVLAPLSSGMARLSQTIASKCGLRNDG
ncbi:MAG: putative NAD-dependent epimerase/dehydratase family protein [Planctomycetota bacterium]|jgi:uncharacterized NAD-dependent epimerase/dehydratase family protein